MINILIVIYKLSLSYDIAGHIRNAMVIKWEPIGRSILLSVKCAVIFILKIIDIQTELPYVHPVHRGRRK
jgi:hypothetical protein